MKTIEKFRLSYHLHDNEGNDVTDEKLEGIIPEWSTSSASVVLRVNPDGRFADVLGRQVGVSVVSAVATVDGNEEEASMEVEITPADVLNASFQSGPVAMQTEDDLAVN